MTPRRPWPASCSPCSPRSSAGPGTPDRVQVPGQAPTTATSTTVPSAPTTCTGGPDDPAACSESEGRPLPDSR
jgi:hypothetical protein